MSRQNLLIRMIAYMVFVFMSGNISSVFAQFLNQPDNFSEQSSRVSSDEEELIDEEDDFFDEMYYEYPSAWNIPREKRPRVQAEERVNSLQRFSLNFYKSMIQTQENQNVVCSPWSVAMVLCMLYEGADAETAREIRKAVRFQGSSKFYEKFLHMILFNARAESNLYRQPQMAILESATSFWGRDDCEFHDDYRYVFLEERFNTEIFTFDASAPPGDVVSEINEWCEEETHGRIREILSANDKITEMQMILINAVYFRGQWRETFDRNETQPEWFHKADGTLFKTEMMKQKGGFSFAELEDFKALRMPYRGNVHMLIILPDEIDGLEEIENNLTSGMIRKIHQKLRSAEVKVHIPRFEFDNDQKLIPVLKSLGIESAFDPDKANFSKMTPAENFFINQFVQKSFIKVDEKGTEAAVVTGASGAGGRLPKIQKFIADRPFLFLICESTDNSILFIGRVHEPEKANVENIDK